MSTIVFASAEVAPYSKTGGLGDVAGALPRALVKRGHELLVVTPLYGSVDRERHALRLLDERIPDARLYEATLDGVRTIFLENEALYGRTGVYGEGGEGYPDNAQRFGFFSRAILPVADALLPAPPDVVHLNDWQTGLAALDLARRRGSRAGLTRSVFTIHNLGYQGVFPKDVVEELGIGWDAFTPEGLEFYDQVNFLKAGLVFSDLVTTVSPTYAREIQEPEEGFGLDGVLRSLDGRLTGILNGIDTREWDPARDPHLAARFSDADLSGKAACRAALCRELSIDEAGAMVIGIVSRFAAQKGFDVVLEALPDLLERDVRLAILGSGEHRYEHWLQRAALEYPGRIGVKVGFHEGLAHRIYAGSDAFLMPSLYEPCGLSQLYALRYGSVPIVRATGGLADTVEEARDGGGTGFLFDSFTAEALVGAVDRALSAFRSPERWYGVVQRGRSKDFSWDASARAYEEAYRSIR
ncbi:glycogen synthase GlgA [Vulgatibacter incomptus]|uniref:Glycogen synthase n=1 Tax=Vulgatibacter incomptus TaxID=1391653 RepID=A0A0K1P7Z6_9BACT|nr:glycogen synthase GlgA [Vulgatibacter incomptus]AKU89640.1 Glycogen synthase, ADP-glucose transglucosylase [Vulgatibacter incomptus]